MDVGDSFRVFEEIEEVFFPFLERLVRDDAAGGMAGVEGEPDVWAVHILVDSEPFGGI